MSISFEVLKNICGELNEVMVQEVFGQPGVDAIFKIMETLRELYLHVEPMRVEGEVIVFHPVFDDSGSAVTESGQLCGDLGLLSPRVNGGIILEIRGDGRRYVHPAGSVNLLTLAQRGVVYQYLSGKEHFLAGTNRKAVPLFDPTALSQFCGHTFFELGEALRNYAATQVRRTSCLILEAIWADQNRLFLNPGPEPTMRRSLTQFLKARLGAAYEVRPEQIMDESHPVDIKVTKTMTNRLMIIEIKWMGDSRHADGHITVKHRDARALSGAKQLADYLDQNMVQAPLHVTQGYYVIIDARRGGLTPSSTTIVRDDALHYENLEVAFNPEFHKIRVDFDPPYRMFSEPKYCS